MIIPAQTSLQDSGRVSVDGKIIELFSCHTGYMSVPVHLDFFYFLSAVSEGSTAILSESEFTVTPPPPHVISVLSSYNQIPNLS